MSVKNGMFAGSTSTTGGGSMESGYGHSPINQNVVDQGRRQKLKELVRPIFQESYITAE